MFSGRVAVMTDRRHDECHDDHSWGVVPGPIAHRPRPGDYRAVPPDGLAGLIPPPFWVAAGLKISYRWHGSTYSFIAWSVVAACVREHYCGNQVDLYDQVRAVVVT